MIIIWQQLMAFLTGASDLGYVRVRASYTLVKPGYVCLWVLFGIAIIFELRQSKGDQTASRRHEDLPEKKKQVTDDVDSCQPQCILSVRVIRRGIG
jgi:hypothetical protein